MQASPLTNIRLSKLTRTPSDTDLNELDIACETESVYICLHSANMPAALVGTIYQFPDRKKNYLTEVLAEQKKVITTTQSAHIIVGGDFNLPRIKWEDMCPPQPKKAKLLLDTMEELNLHQMVHFPPRKDNTLGLLLTDAPALVNKNTKHLDSVTMTQSSCHIN